MASIILCVSSNTEWRESYSMRDGVFILGREREIDNKTVRMKYRGEIDRQREMERMRLWERKIERERKEDR